jgi:hypothetical protein
MTPEETVNLALDFLVERVKSDPFFAGVEVCHEDDSDAMDSLSQGLAVISGGTPGTAIVWLGPRGTDAAPNFRLGPMGLMFTATVHQNPILLASASPARGYARRLRDLCKHLAIPGLATGLVPLKECIEPMSSQLAPVAYAVHFTAQETAEQNLCADVTFSLTPWETYTSVTLSSTTAGASIYYTTDGTTYPGLPSGATLYSAPFNATTGTTILACAYLSGYIPSLVTSTIIT